MRFNRVLNEIVKDLLFGGGGRVCCHGREHCFCLDYLVYFI